MFVSTVKYKQAFEEFIGLFPPKNDNETKHLHIVFNKMMVS